MHWWMWILLAWVVLAVVAALFLGAAAARIKERERAGRSVDDPFLAAPTAPEGPGST